MGVRPESGENCISQDALLEGGVSGRSRRSHCNFLALGGKGEGGVAEEGAKVKRARESKPPASRLGIASELGQVIIDDE